VGERVKEGCTTPDFWLGIQAQYDIETVREGIDEDIATIKPRKVA
jgi:plasmid maintenance system antidote protein VapI